MKSIMIVTSGYIIAAFLVGNAQAAEAPSCAKEMKSYKNVVECAMANAPDAQLSSAEVNQAKLEVDASGQWKNPEFSANSVRGKSNGDTNSETELELGVPIELGGKIEARRKFAQGGVASAEARALDARAKIKMEVLLKLHRLKQLIHEQEVIDEAIGTFTKLVGQFSNRRALSPEQQLTSTVFRMSKSEYEIKRAETVDEVSQLRAYFQVTIGRDIEELKEIPALNLKSWPELKRGYTFGTSPRSKLAEAELQVSQGALSIAKSESWPTLMIGPSLKLQSEGGTSATSYGLNLSLPLPLFNMNGSGRAAAASGVAVSESKKSFASLGEEKERAALVQVYEESKRVLATSLSHAEIEGRHRDVEALFFKGIVPSALVIEAHRTFVDLEITRNARELKAIEALLEISTIDGTISELTL